MCSLVFGPVRTVTERFRATQKLTRVWFLARVRPLMDFQILQPRERFWTAGELCTREIQHRVIPIPIVHRTRNMKNATIIDVQKKNV